MRAKLTTRQMLNAELAARAANKKTSKVLKHHVPQEEQEDLKITFNCECADPTCRETISLTIKEYEVLHKNFARFVVVKEHTEPKIEKIKTKGKHLSVVEKYALS